MGNGTGRRCPHLLLLWRWLSPGLQFARGKDAIEGATNQMHTGGQREDRGPAASGLRQAERESRLKSSIDPLEATHIRLYEPVQRVGHYDACQRADAIG